jgi:hypothetical protein
MRSIANGEYEKAKIRPALVPLAGHGGQQDDAPEPSDPAIGADEWLAREQHAAARRQEILALFDDEPLARDIIEGRMEDMSADELRELTAVDATAYASKLKLIRRRIDNKFPKGWRS